MEIDSGNTTKVEELEMLRDFWVKFCFQMKTVSDIFVHLERTYMAPSTLWQISLNYLRDNLKLIDLKDKLVDGVLDLIRRERDDKEDVRPIMAKLVHILLAL